MKEVFKKCNRCGKKYSLHRRMDTQLFLDKQDKKRHGYCDAKKCQETK